MEALNESTEDIEWIDVEDSSAPGSVRRAAVALAENLAFSEHRAGEVAIAATELSTNLYRHAVQGTVLLRVRRSTDAAAVELVLIDHGPGMADFAASARDGQSTGGTLGIGIGAVTRLATWFDSHSVVGRGTVMIATFWNGSVPKTRPSVAGVTRPIDREIVCGDAWAFRRDGTAIAFLIADGLGHGLLAADASRAAVRAFIEAPDVPPAAMLKRLNAALRGTRGAAAAIVRVDPSLGVAAFAGIGNASAIIDNGEQRQAFASSPGIVGTHTRPIREVEVPLAADSLVIMHSDGLSAKWDLNNYPGLRTRDPHLVAATLMRDAGIHRDDRSVVVARVS